MPSSFLETQIFKHIISLAIVGALCGCASRFQHAAAQHEFEYVAENEFFGPYRVKIDSKERSTPLDDSDLTRMLPALKDTAIL